jgi:hypothetical protein
MFLTIIYILILSYSFVGLLYYIVDSFQRKEYIFTVGFSFYAMLMLWLIGQAVKNLIMMI